jgi:nitrite reductase/ring-hydroxylating ferredoxin subunit
VTWADLGPAEPAADDELRDVRVGARHVGLARVGAAWIAFDPWCTHAECPLTDGWLEGRALRCACHGALFDLETGIALQGPAEDPIRLFPTRVAEGRVEADLG